MTTDDIHDLIANSDVGDGDRLLDICMALLDQIRELQTRVKRLEQEEGMRGMIGETE